MSRHAGRFSAFIPGWDHMSTPVLKPLNASAGPARAPRAGQYSPLREGSSREARKPTGVPGAAAVGE
ncbi:hypothetical protein [Bradyrhizobium brasilense]|uniref:hypothetical protein n=1 Tax=Bradyrhizobium brasilense TaxID=1419277 RepID=UPI000B881FF8|nr:hypothetical protein [Bradyrhizobium brasilense]